MYGFCLLDKCNILKVSRISLKPITIIMYYVPLSEKQTLSLTEIDSNTLILNLTIHITHHSTRN